MEKEKRKRRFTPLTGEDIEMLHENDSDPQASDYRGSYRYKDDIDGA